MTLTLRSWAQELRYCDLTGLQKDLNCVKIKITIFQHLKKCIQIRSSAYHPVHTLNKGESAS